jgi:hypothetical protein
MTLASARTSAQGLLAAGDVVTRGNHAFDQRETLVSSSVSQSYQTPELAAGAWAWHLHGGNGQGQRVLVMVTMGRVMIEPMLDDPFPAVGGSLTMPVGPVATPFSISMQASSGKWQWGIMWMAGQLWWDPTPIPPQRTTKSLPVARAI